MTSTSAQSAASKPLPAQGPMNPKVASTESEGVQQSGTRRRRRKGRGAAATAGPSSAGAASGRQLVPFHGFPREYAQAHAKTVKEVIRCKEIMIKLLQSGCLTDRQLRAILPSSKPKAT